MNTNTEIHCNNPIFVVGSPRSGTTLLQRMLGSHPRISSPTAESHFIIPLYRNACSFGDLSVLQNKKLVLEEMYNRRQEFFDADLPGMAFDIELLAEELQNHKINSIPGIISWIFSKNAHGMGRARWMDKTPYYVLHIPTILEMFPQAQVVHIIRDGRDAVLSMLGRKQDMRVYNVYHGAKLWQQYVETGHEYGKSLGNRSYLEIKYEELLESPRKAVHTLCDFLGEEFSESVIHFQKTQDPNCKTPLLRKEIQKDNREKWRMNMSKWQIRVFESAAGETLQQFGYPLLTSNKPLPLMLRAAYRVYNRIHTRLRQIRTSVAIQK